ncbi:MAG: hypothetical protein RLZZ596_882 [Pseudomonadota bacterium]|jgi:regulator of sirC expression with transglutaminase-like and TPR domain
MMKDFSKPTPLSYFATLVQSDTHFPLLEAAASLAQDEHPNLDVQSVLSGVDHLLATVRCRIPADAPGVYKLRILNQYFFKDQGFAGNVNHYHDPANSYMHCVLHSRRGIPVSLAVLWLELAQGLGLAARGVSFPGHFLVRVNLAQGQVLIDPFSGESLSREELVERLEPYRRGLGSPISQELPLGVFLQPATPREIIERMLRNLKELYRAQSDLQRLLAVQDRLLVLLPELWVEYRERGLTNASLGQTEQAVQDLETYLAHAGSSEDSSAIAQRLIKLRRKAR